MTKGSEAEAVTVALVFRWTGASVSLTKALTSMSAVQNKSMIDEFWDIYDEEFWLTYVRVREQYRK